MSQKTALSKVPEPSGEPPAGDASVLEPSQEDDRRSISRDAAAVAVAQAQASSAAAATGLDKVRDILFGNQVRLHEQQFQALERRLDRLQTDMKERFDRLDDIVAHGFDSLAQQLQAEQKARQQGLNRAGELSRELETGVSQKLTQLEKKLDKETQSLFQEILDQSSQLTEAMHEKSEALMGELEQEMQKRRSQSQGERAHLSALFGELSARLRDDN